MAKVGLIILFVKFMATGVAILLYDMSKSNFLEDLIMIGIREVFVLTPIFFLCLIIYLRNSRDCAKIALCRLGAISVFIFLVVHGLFAFAGVAQPPLLALYTSWNYEILLLFILCVLYLLLISKSNY